MTTEQTALQSERCCDTCEHGEYSGAIGSEPCDNCDEDTLSSWTPATSPRCETCIHYGAEYPDTCDVCQETETLPDWEPVHLCFAPPATKTVKAKHGSALQRLKAVCEKAQAGEWYHGLEAMNVVEIYAENHSMGMMSEYDDTSICVAEVGATPNASAIDNAVFIATARNALPMIIELCEVMGLWEELADQMGDFIGLDKVFGPDWNREDHLRDLKRKYNEATAAVEASRARLEEVCPK